MQRINKSQITRTKNQAEIAGRMEVNLTRSKRTSKNQHSDEIVKLLMCIIYTVSFIILLICVAFY